MSSKEIIIMQVSKIFQNALKNGGQLLENGSVYTCKNSKYYPNRYIQKVIDPKGNYTIQVSENGNIIKRISKYTLNGTSTLTDSWDFVKRQGIHLSSVMLNKGKSIMSRVFDKAGELSIKQDDVIYLHHFGKPDTYITEIKTLNGISSTPKPFSKLSWLNNEFYKYFNKQG